MNVLSFLSMVAAILNCFTIVVVSRDLHEVEQNDSSLHQLLKFARV